MRITIPVTIQHPDKTVHSPFGDNTVPGEVESATLTFDIDELTAETIKQLLK